MKKIFLALWLTISTLFAIAQNGGQFNENNGLRLDYAGVQSGTHYVQITNKLNKQVLVKVDYAGQFTEVTIPANGVHMWPLGNNPVSFLIRAKNLYCTSNDCGWVELCLTGLPVKFTNFTCRHLSGDDFLIDFVIAEASNVKQFNVQLSLDGKTYKDIAVVWPDTLQPNKKYSIKVKIKKQ
jgi:hypothetical protein